MEQQHNLTDIGNVLTKVMDNPIAKTIRSGAIGALGIVNPVAGVAVGIGDSFFTEYNTYKLSLLLKALSSKLNMETRLNELYSYVNSSSDKAISVANLFKETVNAENPKVCIIYGLILANHTGSNSKFTQDELIICKALENATECDLNNFKIIMESYLKQTSNGNKVIFPQRFPNIDEFIITCDWCVYNRIFVSRILEWGEIGEDSSVISTHYYSTKLASLLMEYIKEAQQIWDY